MPSSALAPTTAAASSNDITVAAPNTGTVALYRALDDGIQLEQNIFVLLLESGDTLLLESQAGEEYNVPTDYFPIYLKDPLGGYNPTHWQLTAQKPVISLPVGVWQVRKSATDTAVGIQYDVT
jgi:hypothetical protein